MYEVHCLKPLLISVKNSKLCEKLWFLDKIPKTFKSLIFFILSRRFSDNVSQNIKLD